MIANQSRTRGYALHVAGSGGAGVRLRSRPSIIVLGLALALLALQSSYAFAQSTPGRDPIVVTTTADAPDTSAGDGVCRTAGGQCSVRAAIQEANGLIGHDVVEIPSGTYEIEIPVLNEDFPSTGDHDIADSVTIRGVGAGQTILDGGFPLPSQPVEARGVDRIFEIHPSAGNVTIERLTLQEGYSVDAGGAIQNWSPGLLRIDRVHLLDNLAANEGGALNNADPVEYIPGPGVYEPVASPLFNEGRFDEVGTIRVEESIVARNYAPTDGAGLHNDGDGTLEIVDSTFEENTSEGNGGAVYSNGGKVDIVGSELDNNLAHADGGAFYSNGQTSSVGLRSEVTVSQSSFDENEARAGSGAIHSDGDAEMFATDIDVSQNDAVESSGGGLSVHGRSSLVLTDGRFVSNFALDEGGGLFTASERPIIVRDSRFRANSTGLPGLVDGHDAGGGGIYTEGGPIEILDTDVLDNTATAEGGGLSIDNHGQVD